MPTLECLKVKLVGTKLGMTRIFQDGVSIPVTVIQFAPHQVVQKKTIESDGYQAYQLATRPAKPGQLTAPERGHLRKAGVDQDYRHLFEIQGEADLPLGHSLDVSLFDEVQWVDVSGLTKGRGFTGVIKRWGFKTQPASHGNSLSGRVPGSLGSNQDPGRVWKNKKMPGQYGHTRISVQNLKVIRVDKERGLLIVKGAVPGANGFQVVVQPAVKK